VPYLPHRIILALTALSASTFVACDDPIPMDGTGGTVVDGSGTGGATSSGGTAPTSGGTTGSGGTVGTTASVCGSGDMPFRVFADEPNNMTFSSTIALPEVSVPPSNTALTMDWSMLTQDFLGHDLSFQGGMKAAVLVVWEIPTTEVAAMINADDPSLESHAIVSMQFSTAGGATSAPMTSFTVFGAAPTEEELMDFLNPANGYSYTLMAQAHPSTLGRDVQMLQAFKLEEGAPSTTVSITDTSTTLDWNADLDTLTPTQIAAGQADVLVDWFSTITLNSFGGVFVNNQITEVLVGRYLPDVDLNAQFLDIELIAEDLWRGEVSAGSNKNLSTLTLAGENGVADPAGAPFTGIPAGSTDQWLLALVCTTCVNPTPWYVTRLQPCP